jgi:hypothetical protein
MDGQGTRPLPVLFEEGRSQGKRMSVRSDTLRKLCEGAQPRNDPRLFFPWDRSRSGCSVAFEQTCEMGEGCERTIRLAVRRRFVCPAADLIPLMLIVVTIETEQFPVASVQGIIVMVVVFVMDRELAQFLAIKLSPAVGADPGE